jgi:hypothetical protein
LQFVQLGIHRMLREASKIKNRLNLGHCQNVQNGLKHVKK